MMNRLEENNHGNKCSDCVDYLCGIGCNRLFVREEEIMKITKETIKRAVRTFAQAFIAYITVHIALIDFSAGKEVVKSALIGLGVSALAAGLAGVMNLENSNSNSNLSEGSDE